MSRVFYVSFNLLYLPNMKIKAPLSFASIVVVLLMALAVRFYYISNNERNGYNATSWDAFGYYMYQPGMLLYNDVTKLEWLPRIDSVYQVTGGKLYQAHIYKNGHYVFKYLGGICFLQLPFFGIGHIAAIIFNYPRDGFSSPYQYAIIFGAIFWLMLGLFFLRQVLLSYFSDLIAGLTIASLFLATNLPQYFSVDGAMSHSWIFPQYCIMLWLTHKWHNRPSYLLSVAIGLLCGLATISRPTEIIILFIPLLWRLNEQISNSKWTFLRVHWQHLVWLFLGGFVGVLPQLIYWKFASGSFVYDVGSKWYFLNPWFRVLFGLYSGWFVYTPLTILFILGFWFMRKLPFTQAVITFTVLNIWIVIAWSEWQYGISYSGRALAQGSPVYALSLASVLNNFYNGRKRIIIIGAVLFLSVINFYQIAIYNSGRFNNFSVVELILSKI